MPNVRYRQLDSRSFTLSGSNFVSSGVCNQSGYYIVVDPTIINNLGGTPSSVIAANSIVGSALKQSNFDPAQPAADFASTNWTAMGWNNPNNFTSFRNQVRDWINNNLVGSINPGANDYNFYMVDTTISGTRYLVPIVYLGADGPSISGPAGSPALYLDAGNSASYPGSGNTWYDISGNSRNFTMYNASFTSFYFTFNGSTTYGSRASIPEVENGTSNFTASVWYQRSSLPGGLTELISSWPGTSMTLSFFFGFSGASTVRVGDGYSTSVTGINVTNVWQCLTVVNNATNNNAYLYLNGVLKATKGSRLNTSNSNNTFWIGRQGSAGEYFPGKIGTILIYGSALSAEDIQQNITFFNSNGYNI